MKMMQAWKSGFKNWLDFRGRASRSEYWWFYLLSVLIAIIVNLHIVSIVLYIPLLSLTIRRLHDIGKSWYSLLFLSIIPTIIFYIPLINFLFNSGFGFENALTYYTQLNTLNYIILGWLVIGSIILLYWLIKPGDKKTNKWGPPPLQNDNK